MGQRLVYVKAQMSVRLLPLEKSFPVDNLEEYVILDALGTEFFGKARMSHPVKVTSNT